MVAPMTGTLASPTLPLASGEPVPPGPAMLAQAPVREEEKQLLALNQQGRLDLERLLSNELFPKIDQDDAGADEQRRQDEARGN